MLKIKTRVNKSKIHGIGLFADQFIPKNTVTWEYNPKFDISFSKETIDAMDITNAEYLYYYSYFDIKRNKYILCSDNQRFINHTANKKRENILSTPDRDIAVRDIEIGEELLCDYNKFDSGYFNRLKIKNNKLK